MPNQTEQPVLLFSYGTLQDRAVQLSNFGRELKGRVADYKRVRVVLKSGIGAWVYVRA